MEEILMLIRAKIGRETKEASVATTPEDCDGYCSTIGGENKIAESACWLCARPARFRLVAGFDLCFSCFRRALLLCVLPLINGPQRRESDAAFISKIQELKENEAESLSLVKGTPMVSRCRSNRDTVEVTHPTQASFVMSSSVMRQRCSVQNSGDALKTGKVISREDELWTCPQCTFLNDGGVRVCGACSFHNIGTVICPFCNSLCRMGEERLSQCPIKKALHILWSCSACSIINTVDTDQCYMCCFPLVWACARCTAQQESCRTVEGLRVCRTCRSYNTPMEVIQSRLSIDLEQRRKEAQPGVEFGVNDAETIAEKTRQKDISESKERLARRMEQLGIQHVNVQIPDGNCLFRALANQLFGLPDGHMFVRSLIVAYMRERESDYKVLFDGEEEWSTYLRNMSRTGFWGDELCLNAASRCFHADIHVITSGVKKWHLVFQHEELCTSHNLVDRNDDPLNRMTVPPSSLCVVRKRNKVCLFLVYMAPVHYDDVMPLRALVAHDLREGVINALKSLLEEERRFYCEFDEKKEVKREVVEGNSQKQQEEVEGVKSKRVENRRKYPPVDVPSSRPITMKKSNGARDPSKSLICCMRPLPPPSLPPRQTHVADVGLAQNSGKSDNASDREPEGS